MAPQDFETNSNKMSNEDLLTRVLETMFGLVGTLCSLVALGRILDVPRAARSAASCLDWYLEEALRLLCMEGQAVAVERSSGNA